MRNPFLDAQELYRKNGGVFEAELGRYHARGFVFSTPARILLGRPIVKTNPDAWLNPGEFGSADAWYVQLASGAGDLGWFVRNMPWYLPFLAWHRHFKKPGSQLRIYKTEAVTRRTY